MSERIPFGAHWLQFEPGPLVCIWFHGQVSLCDSELLVQLIKDHLGQHRFFVIADSSQSGGMEPAARKHQIKWLGAGQLSGVAFISSNLMIRTLATLMHNAHRLVSGNKMPLLFCRDDAEARAWIARQMQLEAD
jgi:hypothetical protein